MRGMPLRLQGDRLRMLRSIEVSLIFLTSAAHTEMRLTPSYRMYGMANADCLPYHS